MNSANLLMAQGLGVMRGERILFSDLSLTAAAGDVIVLRGANGSGKTTLLRMLAGLTRPDDGTITRNAAHHWVGHKDGLKPHETPREHLRLWARAWGSSAEIEPILREMDLVRAADVPARQLSAGQRRRTALGRLHLDARPIWLLDEPLTALDTAGAAQIRNLIEAKCQSGGVVLVALHGATTFANSQEVQL